MKNNKCFVDSSALIALNNPKDQYHENAIEIAHQLNQRQLVVSDAVLTETYTFLRYQSGYRVASNFLKIVLGGPSFIIAEVASSTRMATMTLLGQFRNYKISYCDALSVVIMKEQNIDQIFSFDHHFEMMGVRVVR